MQDSSLPLVYDLNFDQLAAQIAGWGEPTYRAKQVWHGIYQKLWRNPEAFTDLPVSLRLKLATGYVFQSIFTVKVQQSEDQRTVKTLFHLRDNRMIEAVLMKYDERRSLCISTQSGCAMGCHFCATGQMGFSRHLSSGEIVEQVLYYARLLSEGGERVTNVVLMGMGEPFHNYQATMAAIDRLNHAEGFNLGARRFTISTVGLVPGIRRFADEKRQVNLAVSLHAVDDGLRSSMMPVNNKYPVSEVLEACRYYVAKTNRRITFEWALIQDVNDSPEMAQQLAAQLKGLLCHVNVIPLNPTSAFKGKASGKDRVEQFCEVLSQTGIPCTIRMRRGIEIQAGCGQLASSPK